MYSCRPPLTPAVIYTHWQMHEVDMDSLHWDVVVSAWGWFLISFAFIAIKKENLCCCFHDYISLVWSFIASKASTSTWVRTWWGHVGISQTWFDPGFSSCLFTITVLFIIWFEWHFSAEDDGLDVMIAWMDGHEGF